MAHLKLLVIIILITEIVIKYLLEGEQSEESDSQR